MKFKIFKPFVCITGVIAMLLLQGCDKELESLFGFGAVENNATVRQVDIDVNVPIQSSSLKYFDYCITYTDNEGIEYRDTVRNASPDNDVLLWRKGFVYKSLPILCKCETILVPKVSKDSEVSFSYVIPKPYIFSRVIFNSHSYTPVLGPEIEGVETVKIDNMRIGTFLSAYGSFYVSTCSVKEEYDGISCSSY